MNKILNFFFAIFFIFQSCSDPKVFEINVPEGQNPYDSLFIQELITGETIAKLPLNSPQRKFFFPIRHSLLTSFQVKGRETSFLSILEPGSRKELVFNGKEFQTKKAIADSLSNYIWHSTEEMYSRYAGILFRQDDLEIVKEKFDSLVAKRQADIQKGTDQLTDGERAILNYQNQARANNFLMFYGRIVRELPPTDSYFDFVEKIPAFGTEAKSLPDVLLYQYEIEYLRKNVSIRSIPSFLEFIESRTSNQDLRDFLKAYYIQSVIEFPTYWRPHEHLFTTDQIQEALASEKNNPYAYLINRASDSFFSSMAGVAAYDFAAKRLDDSSFKLSHLRGKLVLIDAWATWCGPCIKHRPRILEIASKYGNEPRMAVVMVSVDSELDRWKNYVSKTNPGNFGYEVNIPDGMNDTFGDKFLVKAIPKYFLIDSEGIILSSDLPEPSLGMEQLIEKELGKMKKSP